MEISIWTPEREDALRKYCALKTLTFREIADQLTKDFAVSFGRNACIGKAGRLGIRIGPKEVRVAGAKPRPRIVKTGNASFALGSPRINDAETKLRCIEIDCTTSLNDLTGCRFPSGDSAPYLFCNGKQREGSSYCEPHHHLCWEKPKPRHDKYLAGLAA